jgi:hypothetical protein
LCSWQASLPGTSGRSLSKFCFTSACNSIKYPKRAEFVGKQKKQQMSGRGRRRRRRRLGLFLFSFPYEPDFPSDASNTLLLDRTIFVVASRQAIKY